MTAYYMLGAYNDMVRVYTMQCACICGPYGRSVWLCCNSLYTMYGIVHTEYVCAWSVIQSELNEIVAIFAPQTHLLLLFYLHRKDEIETIFFCLDFFCAQIRTQANKTHVIFDGKIEKIAEIIW